MWNLSACIHSFLCCLFIMAVSLCTAWGDATDPGSGLFFQEFWYQPGIEHGNPQYNSRFRVNAPETVLSPFKDRPEARANGMMQILMELDPSQLIKAELYLELWGGHPGTENKRVTINGRNTFSIPEVGTASENCTAHYPTIALTITDLVNGYNALQFACDRGSTFWGHYIVDNASLRAYLKPDDPILVDAELESFSAAIECGKEGELIALQLKTPETFFNKIESVVFQGFYEGFDENGDMDTRDWHGYTKNRQPEAMIGTAASAPYSVPWNVSMLPSQDNMAVRAFIRFKDRPGLVYVTTPLQGLSTPTRSGTVAIFYSSSLPHPFWSRDNQPSQCTIDIDTDPEHIERAELHVVIWDGGRGTVENPFTLNGHPLPVAGEGRHDVIYRVISIDPSWLKPGENTIKVLSDTEHHGIEVLLPGPALILRCR